MQSFDCTKYNRYGFTAKGQDCANVETIFCQLQPTLNKRNRTIMSNQIAFFQLGIFTNRKSLEREQIWFAEKDELTAATDLFSLQAF